MKINKGFSRIDNILVKNIKNQNFQTAFYKHKALKHWHEIAGAFILEAKDLTQAVDFKKGVLTVACLSREVASKIKLFAESILEALNQVLGARLVFAIYTEC
jgi:hypothetical protein